MKNNEEYGIMPQIVECYKCDKSLAAENAVRNRVTGHWYCPDCAKEATKHVISRA